MAAAVSTPPKRVVVWSTGGNGSSSIVGAHERPDVEPVGGWVHSPDEAGRDVEMPLTIPRHVVRA